MKHLTLSIDGMSCGHCLQTVRSALDRLPGVTVEHVAIGGARLSYDPSQTSPERIVEAVDAEGYSAHAASAA
ncbi:MAG TPA: cation transporter [Gemmatimonadaceae bacterium]|nr:cation transporter [Gemmatimonadaceae bacterium]